jgi:VanZ family protein
MKWLTLAFILFLLLIVIVADVGLGGTLFAFLDRVPGGDKTGHFLLMGTLALLVNLSLSAARITAFGAQWLKGSLIVAALVTMEEFSQLGLQWRGFSLIDLAADYAGILLFGWLAARIVARRAQPI